MCNFVKSLLEPQLAHCQNGHDLSKPSMACRVLEWINADVARENGYCNFLYQLPGSWTSTGVRQLMGMRGGQSEAIGLVGTTAPGDHRSHLKGPLLLSFSQLQLCRHEDPVLLEFNFQREIKNKDFLWHFLIFETLTMTNATQSLSYRKPICDSALYMCICF